MRKGGEGHLSHADTWHILKAIEYELLFFEAEKALENKEGQNSQTESIILKP